MPKFPLSSLLLLERCMTTSALPQRKTCVFFFFFFFFFFFCFHSSLWFSLDSWLVWFHHDQEIKSAIKIEFYRSRKLTSLSLSLSLSLSYSFTGLDLFVGEGWLTYWRDTTKPRGRGSGTPSMRLVNGLASSYFLSFLPFLSGLLDLMFCSLSLSLSLFWLLKGYLFGFTLSKGKWHNFLLKMC